MGWTVSASGTKATTAAAAATLSIAAPAVATVPHNALAGDLVSFTTTGALPTGITAGQNYYLIASGLTGNQFQFAASPGGTAINSSGTQSGTHTATFEHVLTTDSNNATFWGEIGCGPMILGDGLEVKAYDLMLAGAALLQIWKGSFNHAQFNDHKPFPFIASDLSIQYTVKALANAYTGTATFSNGSANITVTGNLLQVNDVVQFTSSGGLPTNFSLLTNYYVVSSSGNTFTVAATLGGTAIVAGSAGTGTQTMSRIGHSFPWKVLRQ